MQSVSLIENLSNLVIGIQNWFACCMEIVCFVFVRKRHSLILQSAGLDGGYRSQSAFLNLTVLSTP